jgi:hypothetical protein
MRERITRLGAESAFTQEEVDILVAAFDSAWGQVRASGAPFALADYEERARDVIAKAIIDSALLGELNPRTLTDGALMQLSKTNLRRSRPYPH